MPHSSGGGSHGGGSHSGGSSSRGGSSQPAEPRVSNRYYPGATRYVYYGGYWHRPHYVYFKGEPKKPKLSDLVVSILVLLLVAGIFLFTLYDNAFFFPAKTDLNSYASQAVVEDHVGLITDTESLNAAISRFQAETGVTPSVEVVSDSEWNTHYTSLENFALNEYLRLFSDEKHWLFVLSYPGTTSEDGFIAWSWEGMIGDEVSSTVNEAGETKSQSIMQQALIRADGSDLGTCLANALDQLSAAVMEPQKDTTGMVIFFGACAIVVVLLYGVVADYKRRLSLVSGAVKIDKDAQEVKCEFCQSAYIPGTVTNCPHCGAPARAEQQ